ncbi:hypothetical protein BJ742DRAFT_578769 [Cladochytrium replicatum]|nr:hypothetical protein BJ742DRAFT_578769 [Cladochytrium replicatum]
MSVETQLAPSMLAAHRGPAYRKAARSLELRVGKGTTIGGMTLGGVPVSPRSPGSPKLSSLAQAAAAAAAAAASAASSPAEIVSASRTLPSSVPAYTTKTRTSPNKLHKSSPLSPNASNPLSPALTPSTARRITHAFVAKVSVEKVKRLFSSTRAAVAERTTENMEVQVRRTSVPLWKLLLIDRVLDKLEATQPGISMTVFRSNSDRRKHWTTFKTSDDASSPNESRTPPSKSEDNTKPKSQPPSPEPTLKRRRCSSPLRFEVEIPEEETVATSPDVKRIAAETRRPSLKIEDILAVPDPSKIESSMTDAKPEAEAPMAVQVTICGVLGFDKNPRPQERKTTGFWSIFCCFA